MEIVKETQQLAFDKPFRNKEEERKTREEIIIEKLMDKISFATLSDTKEILYYDNRGYVSEGHDKIAEECEKLYPKITSYEIREIQGHIRRRTLKRRDEFDKYPILNLKNGLLDLRTFKLCPHSPRYYSIIRHEIKYEPKAKCPQILRFLRTTLNGSDVKMALSLCSLALERNTEFQIAGMFVGSGNNGKGVFFNLLTAIFGKNNVSAVSLHELDIDRFASADLYGKLLNVCGDLPSKPISDTSIFKKIVGGDLIRAQKKFQQPFSFKPQTMLMFSTNKIPETPDITNGFFRRWMIISFPNNFEGKEDRKLMSKITTQKELSGFLNLLIESIKWRRRNGKLPGIESIEQRETTYNRMQNSVECFAEECVGRQVGNKISKNDLYEDYCNYCEVNNIPPESKEGFGKKLIRLGFKHARPTIQGNRIHVWKDISLSNHTTED